MCHAANQSRKQQRLVGLGVIILAAGLRLPGLERFPPPLNQDEASRGYDAWCILETGADRHGRRWPFFLEGFGPGDYTAALTTYITVPFVAVLGPRPLAMRLPDALLGVLTIWLLHAWLRRHTGEGFALAAAALLATDPWHITLSRSAHEAGFAPFFLALALFSLSRVGLHPGVSRISAACWAVLAGFALALHAWVYPATRLFTPLLCLAFVIVYFRDLARLVRSGVARPVFVSLLLGLIVGALPLIVTVVGHPEKLAARARISLLTHGDAPLISIAYTLAANYLANFDPRYLFLQGEDFTGAQVPGFGLHLLLLAVPVAIGTASFIRQARRSAWARFLLAWLLLSPLPAAICVDWNPHPMRPVGGMLLFPILAAEGVCCLAILAADWLLSRWRRAIAAAVLLLFAANSACFVVAYVSEHPLQARVGYQTALVEAMQWIAPRADQVDFVLVTNYANQAYIYALLYAPIAPQEYARAEKLIMSGKHDFHQVLRVGNFYFAPLQSSEAAARFGEALAALPPMAEGLVLDIQRPDISVPGKILARFAVGDPRHPGQVYEIRRWRLSDQPVGGGPSAPSAEGPLPTRE